MLKEYFGFGISEEDINNSANEIAEMIDYVSEDRNKTIDQIKAGVIIGTVLEPWRIKASINTMKALNRAKVGEVKVVERVEVDVIDNNGKVNYTVNGRA